MFSKLSKLSKKVFAAPLTFISLSVVSLLCIGAGHVNAATLSSPNVLSLQNLERERAALIQDILSPTLDVQQRHQQLIKRQRQLTDMERMVMRDERLLASSSTLVKNAFTQYELTFLVHAGAENKRSASQQWFQKVNLTNKAVLSTQVGFRK